MLPSSSNTFDQSLSTNTTDKWKRGNTYLKDKINQNTRGLGL